MGKFYPHVEPSAKGVKRIKARMTELTARNRTWEPGDALVLEVN